MSNDKLPVPTDSCRDLSYELHYDECGFFPLGKSSKPSKFSITPIRQSARAGAFEAKVLRDVFRIEADQIPLILSGINSGDDIHIKPASKEVTESRLQQIDEMRERDGIKSPNIFLPRKIEFDLMMK